MSEDDNDNSDVMKAYQEIYDSAKQLKGMNPEEIEALVLQTLNKQAGTNSTVEELVGQGPGQFEVLEDERGLFIRKYMRPEYYERFAPKPPLGAPDDYLLLTPDSD